MEDNMDELLAALNELLARQAAGITDLTTEELTALDAEITDAATALAEAGAVTDEGLAALETAGTAVQAIRAEQDSRDAAAAERAERAEAALALVRGPAEDDDEGDPEAEGEVEEVEETAPVIEGETAPETEPVPEPIAAAAPRRPLTRVAARRPGAASPRPPASGAGGSPFAAMHMVASANAEGLTSGSRINSYEDVARGFLSAIKASMGYRGPQREMTVFTVGRGLDEYPESHRLSPTNTGLNMERIESTQRAIRAAGGLQAGLRNGITAAGGICAPSEIRYDLPGIMATDAQPLRDEFMTRFGAARGGVRTLPGLLIEDLDSASTFWTEANDIDALDGTPSKTCMRVTCDNDESETIVEAAIQCLIYGNFMAQYFPERVAAFMEKLSASHARIAESRRLAAITTGATQTVTVGQTLGTVRDLMTSLDRIRAVWNYRHRTPDAFTLAIALPRWLRDNIRTDVTRQLPVGSVTETLSGLSNAQIDALIRERSFEPTWLLDGESGQGFHQQGNAPLQGWPNTVKGKVAPAGAWLNLDGGEINIGIMRGWSETQTNDVRFFTEDMSGTHFYGVEAWNVELDVCPDGSTSSTVDINPCSTGS